MVVNGKNKISQNDAVNSLLYSRLYLPVMYANKHEIDYSYFAEREKIASTITFSALQSGEWGNKVNIKKEGHFLENDSYIQTLEESNYYYWGELNKSKQPDGYGVIFEGNELSVEEDREYSIKYIGEFKDGRYNGYGAEFVGADEYTDGYDSYGDFYSNLPVMNYIEYEGYFEDGERKGDGIEIYCDAGSLLGRIDGNYQLEDVFDQLVKEINYFFYIGSFKDGTYDGNIKIYFAGVLAYEGECKKGSITGTGTQYFSDPVGQVQYKGDFVNGNYNGEGTLYDESGKIIHKGKFTNGDISS